MIVKIYEYDLTDLRTRILIAHELKRSIKKGEVTATEVILGICGCKEK